LRSKFILSISIITIILFFAILACNKPVPLLTPDLNLMVAQTKTALSIELILNNITTTFQASVIPDSTPSPSLQPTLNNPIMTQTSITPTTPECTDIAKFISETIPDGTILSSGSTFIKTWTIQNVGTCTWTPDYSLVFIRGEQMGGTNPSPVGQIVQPNSQIQLFLPLTAPEFSGDYQGLWKLRNTFGQEFGLGISTEVSFWVKITTIPGSNNGIGAANIGEPYWKDTFDTKSNTFYLGEDTDIGFKIIDGELIMTAFQPTGDQWRVANVGYLDNFYIEAKFRTRSKCSGKDSYGLIIRALDKPDSIINSGYVFGFSCEGRNRIYRMDNGNYLGIQNWTNNSSIIPGSNQENTIGIKAEGGYFQLFVNGTKSNEFTDNTYLTGMFGLMIRSDSTENLQIGLKEIAYWIIND